MSMFNFVKLIVTPTEKAHKKFHSQVVLFFNVQVRVHAPTSLCTAQRTILDKLSTPTLSVNIFIKAG